jgi:hypothetical protein
MPTAETTLIPASGNQRATKRSLTSDARLDNEPNLLNDVRFSELTGVPQSLW